MLIIVHFYTVSEASLLSLDCFANYMNVQKRKNNKSTRDSSKGIRVLSEYAKKLRELSKGKILAKDLGHQGQGPGSIPAI